MTIRPANEEDLPYILDLTRQSLGEPGGLRTEQFWKWKHHRNPFGPSPVWLAREGDEFIGLRAFLPWKFTYQGETIHAFRAVDTATHPDHQGKGIFSKLTLALIDKLREGDPSVIFNTPNKKSRPGYLKMGWKTAGKMRLKARIYPLNILRNRFKKASGDDTAPFSLPDNISVLLERWKEQNRDVVMTEYSVEYLQWRYGDVPGISYRVKYLGSAESYALVIYRLKSSSRLNELRIVELFYRGENAKRLVSAAVSELEHEFRPDVITLLADPNGRAASVLPFGFFRADKFGLTLTVRKVNDDRLEALALDRDKWSFSAGTLELL